VSETTGLGRWPSLRAREDTAAAAQSALGAQRFAAAWAAGRVSGAAALEEALALAEQMASAPTRRLPPDPAGRLGLTAREHEVLRLMAEGRSDREIAAELSLAYRTVTSYVTSILNKFGVASRTAAVTQAHRSGLL
jgi:DNA-binding NarL/FixJ family response regulator